MLILGIDPGTATTGYGVIRADEPNGHELELSLVNFGLIQTASTEEMSKRLLILRNNLLRVVDSYKPDCMVVERIFFGRNVRTALSVGQARGVIMLVSAEANLPIHEYTSLQVKSALANHGHADKEAVHKAVKKFLNKRKLPDIKDQTGKVVWSQRDNAHDAAAIAIFHALKSLNRV